VSRVLVVAPSILAMGVAAPAFADRSAVPEIGIMLWGRSSAATFSEAGNKSGVQPMPGLSLVVGYEDAPMAVPAPGEIGTDLRLVPELVAGVVADDRHGEGYVGAGLRGELHLASARRGFEMRTSIYTAVRAIVIGENRDGAAELLIGEYLLRRSGVRFGWEGGALIRPRADRSGQEPGAIGSMTRGRSDDRELDAIAAIYVGW
jgi:hypothetical protein